MIEKAEKFKVIVIWGEMSVLPLDQLTIMVDKVIINYVHWVTKL